jgi:ABC-type multidrug transport system fused ATPase/permease subunit
MSDRLPEVGRRLAAEFGPDCWGHRRALAWSYGLSMIGVGAVVLSPWPLKIIIDHVLASRPLPAVLGPLARATPGAAIAVLTAGFLLLTVIGAWATARERVVTSRVRERISVAFRDRMLAHLQTLPPTIRSAHRSGELVYRLVGDVEQFVRLLMKTLPLVVRFAATILLSLVAMAWVAPLVGLVSLLLLPFFVALFWHYAPRLRAASRQKRRREGEVAGFAQEVVRGLPVIQALGGDRQARERFGTLNAESLRAGVEETRLTAGLECQLDLLRGLALAVATGGGAILVLGGHLTLGELTVLASYVTQIMKPVDKVNDLAEAASRGLAAGERLVQLLAQTPLVVDRPDAITVGRAAGRVELHDVWFSYPPVEGRSAPVLQGINLTLEPGALTVLVGRSGAGKSTLLSLLVRLFDPTRGEVRLDGVALPGITVRSLRAQIAVMTQDLQLFSGTLRDALTPMDAALDDERRWAALEFVALAEFVRGLPGGLDAPLGEDGVNLSGGQRQRLSLARALLLDRPILLLDEPLANVDAMSARVILDALQSLKRSRTCLAITHEPRLLEHADRVYRLEHGRLAPLTAVGAGPLAAEVA